jgi:integrase
MGLYRRGVIWWMSYGVNGRPRCESTGTTNKRLAQKILDSRKVAVIEGRFQMLSSNAPRFDSFSSEFLNSIRHDNTKKRYASSVRKLLGHFGDISLSAITPDEIERFKIVRLKTGTRAATVNRDLAVLRHLLKIASKRRLVSMDLPASIEMLEERKERRQPHILNFDEEERLLAVAPDHIRMLVILILETGLRSRSEALGLRWEDVDLANDAIRIRISKTLAGRRSVPINSRCKAELFRWKNRFGLDVSDFVFRRDSGPQRHYADLRISWRKTLELARLKQFWIYDLRHTFASRMLAAGVSQVFVAQIMGHSNPSILHIYAKAVDDFRRAAVSQLEAFRAANVRNAGRQESPDSVIVR